MFAGAGRVEPELYRREAAFARMVFIALGGLRIEEEEEKRLSHEDASMRRRPTLTTRDSSGEGKRCVKFWCWNLPGQVVGHTIAELELVS